MRQLWVVYLLRFSCESPVLDIFPTDMKNIIRERSCKILAMKLNQIIFTCLQTVMCFMYLYLFVYVVWNAPLELSVLPRHTLI